MIGPDAHLLGQSFIHSFFPKTLNKLGLKRTVGVQHSSGTLEQLIPRQASCSYQASVTHQIIFINTLNEKGPLKTSIQVEPRMIDPEAYVSFSSSVPHSLIKQSNQSNSFFSPSCDPQKPFFEKEISSRNDAKKQCFIHICVS